MANSDFRPVNQGETPADGIFRTAHGGETLTLGGDYAGCLANQATCKGPKAKGSEYCIGHLRMLEKQGWVD